VRGDGHLVAFQFLRAELGKVPAPAIGESLQSFDAGWIAKPIEGGIGFMKVEGLKPITVGGIEGQQFDMVVDVPKDR
jgi:hypothetical protein